MAIDAEALSERVSDLMGSADSGEQTLKLQAELYQGTLGVLHALYGRGSAQEQDMRSALDRVVRDVHPNQPASIRSSIQIIRGMLENLDAEIEAGLPASLQKQALGEVLTDLIAFARRALDEGGDGAKNVAAVLTAAAFEDTVRRLANSNGIPHHEKLADTLTALKDRGLIRGTEIGVAQSYLTFRNRALHAQWDQIDLPVVQSALAFTEQLVLRGF